MEETKFLKTKCVIAVKRERARQSTAAQIKEDRFNACLFYLAGKKYYVDILYKNMITTNYLHKPKHSNSPILFGNGINFTGKNHLITPTNTNMQCSLGNENLALLDKIRLIGKANGQEIYLVGGAVRDCLLGKEPHDLDIMW